MKRTDQSGGEDFEIEVPHPELTFATPSFEPWVICPECRSRHGTTIKLRELDEDATAWFVSNTVIWLECGSCGHVSKPRAGDFVEQPEGDGGYNLREKFKEWLDEIL